MCSPCQPLQSHDWYCEEIFQANSNICCITWKKANSSFLRSKPTSYNIEVNTIYTHFKEGNFPQCYMFWMSSNLKVQTIHPMILISSLSYPSKLIYADFSVNAYGDAASRAEDNSHANMIMRVKAVMCSSSWKCLYFNNILYGLM